MGLLWFLYGGGSQLGAMLPQGHLAMSGDRLVVMTEGCCHWVERGAVSGEKPTMLLSIVQGTGWSPTANNDGAPNVTVP